MMKTLSTNCRTIRSPSPVTATVRVLPPMRAKFIPVLAGGFALLGVAACERPARLEPETSGPPGAGAEARAMAEELGEDPHMVALAREIPGFGGYWYESPGGRLVVALTESSAAGSFPVARRAVLARLAADVTHASSLTNEWIGLRRKWWSAWSSIRSSSWRATAPA